MPNEHETLTELFTDIADAIREKTGETATIKADDFPAAIADIETGGGGITPTGTITITENGTHDVTQYASALVNVAGGGGGLPEGITAIKAGSFTVDELKQISNYDVVHNLGTIPKGIVVWCDGMSYAEPPSYRTIITLCAIRTPYTATGGITQGTEYYTEISKTGTFTNSGAAVPSSNTTEFRANKFRAIRTSTAYLPDYTYNWIAWA
ncbi:MAG: hypothetical protein MJZ20_08430 [Bacteroidaceae bacterium]|nr:hypothetical protein [Bacteroidaceae bacterium]